MQRNLPALSNQRFDLLVIGGGMYGACVAWEATLRGLSVALVEQSDFASATSANSLKVIHGGLRYLQTADLPRMRQSIRERQTLMRIAPHLVHPLPVLVPTYGHGVKGREAMTVALKLNDVISGDRNWPLKDPQKHIPNGQVLSKAECLDMLPHLSTDGLTGAARFHDAQVYNSEQLVLAFLQSAAQQGAEVANYTRVADFLTTEGRVIGAVAQDQLTGDRFEIRATTTINAAGPWVGQLMAQATGSQLTAQPLAKAMNLVTRPLFGSKQTHAIGITGREPGSRLFFIAPWRDRSLVGTWYGPDDGAQKPPVAKASEIESFLAEISRAYPSFQLTPDDVEWVHTGLLPSNGTLSKSGDIHLHKHFQLQDHRADGFAGLLSISGVKYTTARDVAQRAVDWVFCDRQASIPPSHSHCTTLQGGHIEQFEAFLNDAIATYRHQIPTASLRRLVYNYGSEYTAVLEQLSSAGGSILPQDITSTPNLNSAQNINQNTDTPTTWGDDQVLAAEVKYSLANTMPQHLSDVIFRRTELGSAGYPGDQALQICCQTMAAALGWNVERQQAERLAVEQKFRQQRTGQPLA